MRHAHAGDRDSWHGEDRLRPLSEKGRLQAVGLVRLMEGAALGRVMSSPYLRCVETVEPLAAARAMSVEEEPALAEGSDWHDTLALIEHAETPAVLCSQGDVIGELISSLVAAGLLASSEARWQKASTWVMVVEDGEIRSADYLSPPAGGQRGSSR
ncbi:MAG TPA: phosphoglycerate mutase family protein [Candidatus Dormibacteraeota bacterium]